MRRSLAALVLVASCGGADTWVSGSLNGNPRFSQPQVSFANIGSVISGDVNLTDVLTGQPLGLATAVIISDQRDLCTSLGSHSDLFQSKAFNYNALVLLVPLDRTGNFQLDVDLGTAGEIISAWTTSHSYNPAHGGTISVGAGGQGSFELLFGDSVSQTLVPFSGAFKATPCPALAKAALPLVQLQK